MLNEKEILELVEIKNNFDDAVQFLRNDPRFNRAGENAREWYRDFIKEVWILLHFCYTSDIFFEMKWLIIYTVKRKYIANTIPISSELLIIFNKRIEK